MAGPEIGGLLVWQNMCRGVRAHYKAATKEYYVQTEQRAARPA